MNTFPYAEWNPIRGTVPAYLVDPATDRITLGEMAISDGAPVDQTGAPLESDGETRRITGWAHSLCESFSSGKVLIPLRKSMQ